MAWHCIWLLVKVTQTGRPVQLKGAIIIIIVNNLYQLEHKDLLDLYILMKIIIACLVLLRKICAGALDY